MSHSSEGRNGTKFAYDSGLDGGELHIVRPDGATFDVDADDVVELVYHEHLKSHLVSIIGDLDIAGMLGFWKEVSRDMRRALK